MQLALQRENGAPVKMRKNAAKNHPTFNLKWTTRATTKVAVFFLHEVAFTLPTGHRLQTNDLTYISGKICMVRLVLPGGSRTICTRPST